jgi:predicted AAA+ superfamily ATPase
VHRTIFNSLQKWAAADRKVMLLRGARQVGKTYAVRHLAKSFDSFLEVNFEEEKEHQPRYSHLP